MSEHRSFLCVGGPLAGQRYASKNGKGFASPLIVQTSIYPELAVRDEQEAVKVEHTYYRAETFHTPQGDTTFWTPEGQTPLETITLLLDSYEQREHSAPLSAPEGWRPIEEVPDKIKKDGTNILAVDSNGLRRVVQWWPESAVPAGWFISIFDHGSGAYMQNPTHYMPLPAPPKESTS